MAGEEMYRVIVDSLSTHVAVLDEKRRDRRDQPGLAAVCQGQRHARASGLRWRQLPVDLAKPGGARRAAAA